MYQLICSLTSCYPQVYLDVCHHRRPKFIYICRPGIKGTGYIIVEPLLTIFGGRKPEQVLPLNGLCCQTVVSKLLGPLEQWDAQFEVTARSGYNCVHFTPVEVILY